MLSFLETEVFQSTSLLAPDARNLLLEVCWNMFICFSSRLQMYSQCFGCMLFEEVSVKPHRSFRERSRLQRGEVGGWTLETFSMWLLKKGRRLRECSQWSLTFHWPRNKESTFCLTQSLQLHTITIEKIDKTLVRLLILPCFLQQDYRVLN